MDWLKNKRVIWIALAVVFLVFFSTKIVFAYSFNSQFAGRIVYTKAIEIQALEMAGFQCVVPGSTIQIISIGSPARTPTSYYIPPYVRSKTGNSTRASQLIIGKYGGKMAIACTSKTVPPVVKTVNLDIITLFGNSK